MSGNDDGGEIVQFPKIFLPGSFDAPAPGPANDGDGDGDDQAAPVASMHGLPTVSQMAPPLALTLPGVPTAPHDDGGEFVPPAPADPENPTGREMVQVCMAIVTAMGVAAAQGMWHRARQRQVLADKARQSAEKTHHGGRSATAAHHSGGGSRGASGSKGGVLTGSRHEAGSRRRASGSHGSPRPGEHKKRPGSSHGGDLLGSSHKKRGHKAPKSTKNGRTVRPAGAISPKGHKRRKGVKGGLAKGACVQTSTKRPGSKGGDTRSKKRPDASAASPKPAARKMTWKAPRKSQPGPGGARALPPGRRRWTRPGPASTSKPTAATKAKRKGKGRRSTSRRRTWLRWRSSPAWSRSWKARRKTATSAKPTGSTGSSQDDRTYWDWATSTPPPPPRAEWMRPPPGADRRVRIRVERVDNQPRPRPKPAVLVGAPAAGWPALPPAAASPSKTDEPTTSAQSTGGQMSQTSPNVPAPRASSTQYADADLTILDVIEADADMAEEITEGVDEARATVDGCERLLTRLEALHAEIVDLKVPGVLVSMFMLIIDKTLSVKAKAEAVAATLPAASEAISIAGSNAAARHKPLADAVKDAGHIRPAEREYHDE